MSKDGIKVDPEKIEGVACWPEPTNLNEIQQFLGLTSFFRKYIQGNTNLTLPLTVLLKKNTPFDWNTACQNAFAGLKTALTSAPCLALPDTSEGSPIFDLVCDAAGFGLGAVLIQQGRPIAFWSRNMVPAEQNYHITEQKLLAVIEALKAFRCYVDGIPFNLVTDHKPNTFLDTQPTLSRRQTRWSEHLQRFNFIWEYRPGRTNVADPLSCKPGYCPAPSLVAHALRAQLCVTTQSKTTPVPAATPVTPPEPALQTQDGPWGDSLPPLTSLTSPRVTSVTSPHSPATPSNPFELAADTVISKDMVMEVAEQPVLGLYEEPKQSYQSDAWFANSNNLQDLKLLDGLWWKGDCLVIPNVSRVRTALLWDCHDIPYAGHLGVNKTLHNMHRSFLWQGMFSDINGYIRVCVSCQRRRLHLSSHLVYCNLCTIHTVLRTVSLLTLSQVFLRPRQAMTLSLPLLTD